MKRVLVTGGNGFLGRHLCAALAARGDFVASIVRDAHNLPAVGEMPTLAFGDVRDTALVERVIADYELDTVIHLAAQAQVSVAQWDPAGTLDSNVRGTWSVLEACRRQKVRRVITASSDKAYGDGAVPYGEAQGLRPHGLYSTSKACADMIADSYQREYGLSIAVTRCANLYGPGHCNWSALIPGTIRSVLRSERPVLRSDGSMLREYLYVKDAVAAYLALADSDQVGPFNFGTECPQSALEVVRHILALMESELEPDVRGEVTARTEIAVQALDSCKARARLPWAPKWKLDEGLRETIAWHREYSE